jgi:fucose permease
MEIGMSSKFRTLFPCYFAFFVNGAMVLMVGSVLPYIISEAGISYGKAGSMLSAFAIGNLLASFVNPPLVSRLGRKATIVLYSALLPITWLVVAGLPSFAVMCAAFVLMGIGRGSVSIYNNVVVNDNTNGKPSALNMLHMTFAMGAFISPFMTSVFINLGYSWRGMVYTVVAGSALACFFYGVMSPREAAGKKTEASGDAGVSAAGEHGDVAPFYKNPVFYVMGMLLFLYLGLENCVNGWFVTYFKSMGIMSDSYASDLVSITWVMVMVGRLLTAKITGFVDKNRLILVYCVATAAFFLLLISTNSLAVITLAIAGLGFFFAGIYPTTIASVGGILRGSTTGMSMFLAIAALGGIVTPQLVGVVADKTGLVGAILLLGLNAVGMLVTSFINVRLTRSGRAAA